MDIFLGYSLSLRERVRVMGRKVRTDRKQKM
jgi:hypothetical protein